MINILEIINIKILSHDMVVSLLALIVVGAYAIYYYNFRK